MMTRLTPETLDEQRLQRSVPANTYRAGQNLFNQGLVLVREVTDLTASCIVQDRRNYRVNIRLARTRLIFECSCEYNNRGLVCEHAVAAWLGILKHLRQHLFPEWRTQLRQVMDSAQSTPKLRSPSSTYLLFFSLQPPVYTTDEHSWQIFPYKLPWQTLPEEIQLQSPFPSSELSAWTDLFQSNPSLNHQLRTPRQTINPLACLNCSAQSVSLANLFIENERANPFLYHSFGPSIEETLGLLLSTGSPLFLGDSQTPLHAALNIIPEPARLHFRIDRQHEERSLGLAEGLALEATLKLPSKQYAVSPDEITLISSPSSRPPLWALADQDLFILPADLSYNLYTVLEENSQIFIPHDHQNDFINKFYLDLAQRFSLEGDAVEWQTRSAKPVPHLYLSDPNGELAAELRFAYDDLEVIFDPNPPAESTHTDNSQPDSLVLVRLQRQPQDELSAYETLASPAFGLKRAPSPARPGMFCLRARTHPVDFLLTQIPRLSDAGFEIYGEEQLKSARVNRNKPTISFNVTSEIDWFDIQAIINYGELEVSLKEIRRAMRHKQHYVKLSDGSMGEIPEEWFEQYRHLFALSEAQGENLRLSRHHLTLIDLALNSADRTQVDAQFEHQRSRLRALLEAGFQGITRRDLPPGFFGELRPYQKAGVDWLHFLHEFEFGGCLADDMGLGKTVQTLVFLQSLYHGKIDDEHRPEHASLLVVPRSLLINWQREASRFTPELHLVEYFEPDRSKDIAAFDQADVIITTYGVMLRDIQFLHSYTFDYAILDESQAIKNPLSQTGRAARLIQSKHRLVLTGTPIENSTVELWSQFAFLNPGLLGSIEYFKKEFGTPIEKKSDESTAQTLRRLVYPFILRRTKDQVAPELPPRTERILYSDMQPAQRKLYNRTRDFYRGLVLGMLETEGLVGSRMKILEGLLRLRQISIHPLLADSQYRGESGKFELLFDTIETLHAEGHKALIFSQFVNMLSLVRAEMDKRHLAYAYLDGSTRDRQSQVDLFQNDPSLPFFLISLRAGGLGLNLTAADYVIHIDPWWNPAVENQASDRTHRIGQDKPVFIFKLITRDSVEEKILLLQERKKNLVEQIITTEAAFFKNLGEDDIRALFSE